MRLLQPFVYLCPAQLPWPVRPCVYALDVMYPYRKQKENSEKFAQEPVPPEQKNHDAGEYCDTSIGAWAVSGPVAPLMA